MQFFDNYEDGQLSMFDPAEDSENIQAPPAESSAAEETLPTSGSAGIRIRNCSCCGKMLFVREADGRYSASCNACGVSYVQAV